MYNELYYNICQLLNHFIMSLTFPIHYFIEMFKFLVHLFSINSPLCLCNVYFSACKMYSDLMFGLEANNKGLGSSRPKGIEPIHCFILFWSRLYVYPIICN